MHERFTNRAIKVLELSLREALRRGANHVSPADIRRALEREEVENAGKPDVSPPLQLSGVTIKTRLVEVD